MRSLKAGGTRGTRLSGAGTGFDTVGRPRHGTTNISTPSTDDTTIIASAFAFDMDGTLVDSTAVVERVWRDWAAGCGVAPETLLAHVHGRRALDVVRSFAPHLDAEREVGQLVHTCIERPDGIRAIDGAADLLASLPERSWCIVTSAPRDLAIAWLRHAGLPVPGILIAAEDVEAGKPDPEGYQRAARSMGIQTGDMVVFEDAPAGFEAARRAGARLVAVGSPVPSEPIADRTCIPSFMGVRYLEGRLLLDVPRPS